MNALKRIKEKLAVNCRKPIREPSRMKVVMQKFILYRWIEISLLVLGLLFFFYFNPDSLMKGIGIGLAIQSALMLFLDYFAEKRGFEYLDFLKNVN